MAKFNTTMATNRKACHDYSILKTYEAGISLKGNEIKSIRAHRINLKDGFVRIRNNQAYLENIHISPFQDGGMFYQLNPRRDRKLLLHKHEIKQLYRSVQHQGITIVPLKVYVKHGRAKVLIGVAKGRHEWDKRAVLKKRAIQKKIKQYMRK